MGGSLVFRTQTETGVDSLLKRSGILSLLLCVLGFALLLWNWGVSGSMAPRWNSFLGLGLLVFGGLGTAHGFWRRERDRDRDTQRAIRTAESALKEFFDKLPLGAMLYDDRGKLIRCNRKAVDILGFPSDILQELEWLSPDLTILQADGNPLDDKDMPITQAITTGRKVEGVVMGLERPDNGSWVWVSMSAEPRLDDQGRIVDVLCVLEDVTSRRTVEAELAIQTFRDRLTGLPNRALFMERLAQAILRTERRHLSAAVLFLDLDRFKVINDSLSHDQGDQLLVQVSKRLRNCIRPEDTVARLGGDEFVVLFEDLTHVNDGLRVSERISKSLEDPFILNDQEVFTTFSMGLALTSSHDTAPGDLVRDAEVAMYRAKARGEGGIEIFDPSMNAQAIVRFQMEGDLRRAIERGEFYLNYQPLVGLNSGLIEGWEALIRWKHPERGIVSPLEFISVAEETGLIVPIGKWVLEEACRQAALWQRLYPSNPPRLMNVNISARQFQQRELVGTVTGALDLSHLEADRLKLEITESVMMRDAQASLEAMKVFRGLNIHLVIDDFGTGYSSLSYLKRFPVDTLKVDKTFVDGLGKDSESTAIVQAVISLAKALGMRVTAEGVETREQMEQLRELQCDQGQGYYFSRPVAAEAAEAILAANQRW